MRRIGILSKSGETQYAHLHFEITNENYPYIRVDNNGYIELPTLKNKGWHWPGNDKKFIEDYYYPPSSFIKFFSVNKVLNPSFEEGNGTWPDGWEVPWPSGATFIWDDTVAHTGSRSVSISNLTSPWTIYSWESSYISVDPSKDYEMSAWFFWSDQPDYLEDAELGFTEWDANGNWIGGGGIVLHLDAGGPGIWQYRKKILSESWVLHSNTRWITISLTRIYRQSTNNNATVWFDNIKLIQR